MVSLMSITSLFSSCVSIIFAFTPPKHWIEGPEFGEVEYKYYDYNFQLINVSSFTISIIGHFYNLTHFPGTLQYKGIATNMDTTHQNSNFSNKKDFIFSLIFNIGLHRGATIKMNTFQYIQVRCNEWYGN